MRDREGVIYLWDEGVLGVVLEYGAYASKVWFFKEGLEFEIMVENDEFYTIKNGVWSIE